LTYLSACEWARESGGTSEALVSAVLGFFASNLIVVLAFPCIGLSVVGAQCGGELVSEAYSTEH